MKMSHNEYKVLLLGDNGVGKTRLITKRISRFHLEDLKQAIGMDFYTKYINVDGQKHKLKIWVMARNERFRFLLSQYCKGANGALILYDITNANTLELLPEWIQILREQVGDIPIMLAGMKLDLENLRTVSREQAQEIAKREGINEYIECSTVTGENIEKVFEILTQLMHQSTNSIFSSH